VREEGMERGVVIRERMENTVVMEEEIVRTALLGKKLRDLP
jgi:ribosomal protein S17